MVDESYLRLFLKGDGGCLKILNCLKVAEKKQQLPLELDAGVGGYLFILLKIEKQL